MCKLTNGKINIKTSKLDMFQDYVSPLQCFLVDNVERESLDSVTVQNKRKLSACVLKVHSRELPQMIEYKYLKMK